MASKKTLTAKNLEVLGVERLAELLIEITTDDAAAKRRLRLELAGREGPAAVAGEVRKRLATIMRSHSFVDRERMPSLARDLETQRRAIVDQVAKHDPVEGLDLIWRFLELAAPVFERCDDGDGMAGDVFGLAAHDLGEIAKKAKPSPTTLADDVFQALVANDYGQYDPLIYVLAPVLGRKGLERLKQRMRSEQPADSRVRRLALRDVADAQGDVDAYIAQYDEETRKIPKIAVEIARRLLAADRADEAWQALEAAGPRSAVRHAQGWLDFEWEDARIEVLEALGRHEDAQQARWTCFEHSLSPEHLRAYLERLPDFDDIEAEERALDHAQNFENPVPALAFLVSWTSLDRPSLASRPALGRAAELVFRQAANLDGNHYEILNPVADALSGAHPLAATLALRSMIDFALTRARSSRYKHAARHLLTCSSLASAIDDFGAFETHEAYEARLRQEHGRKNSFWNQVG